MTRPLSQMSRAVLLAVVLAGLVAGLVAHPGTAGAHAVLERSIPDRGAVLTAPPTTVEFRFNEPVESNFGAVRIFDSTGDEVQGEALPASGDGREIGTTVPESLPSGYYTAIFNVVSADSHPVSGGITFTVDPGGKGETAPGGRSISELLASSESGDVTRTGFWLDRWIGFLALALAVGTLVWLLLVWRPVEGGPVDRLGGDVGPEPGTAAVARRAQKILLAAIAAGLAASVLAIPFQGAVASGKDLWSAFGGGIPGDVISTRFGTVMLVRAAAFLALLPLALLVLPVVRRKHAGGKVLAATGLGVAGAVALVLSPGLAGHASTQDPTWLMLPSDVLHVGAMAVWSGGLAATIWILPAATRALEPGDRTAVLLSHLSRFSTLALAAVAVIAVTGTVQSVALFSGPGDLIDTAFGRAVAIKVLLFAILLGLGFANRNRLIPALVRRRTERAAPGGPGTSVRRNLRLETVLVAVVLAVTAALVSYPPPKSLGMGPASGFVESGGSRIEYTVDPARVGANEVHVYIFDDRTGAPVEVRGLELAFDPPVEGETPIEADVRKAGPGHYFAPSIALAIRGEWTAHVTVRFSRFEERVETFGVKIR